MATISELATRIHETAKTKGFYDKPTSIPEKLMLIVSEIGEACEADRTGNFANNDELIVSKTFEGAAFSSHFENFIKDTFSDELADAVIRILDLAQACNIDIEGHIEAKMRYNETRDYKHNKNY